MDLEEGLVRWPGSMKQSDVAKNDVQCLSYKGIEAALHLGIPNRKNDSKEIR